MCSKFWLCLDIVTFVGKAQSNEKMFKNEAINCISHQTISKNTDMKCISMHFEEEKKKKRIGWTNKYKRNKQKVGVNQMTFHFAKGKTFD